MDVKDIIWHLDNFINTNKGWKDFLGGFFGFFAQWDDILGDVKGTNPGGFTNGATTLRERSSK